ncbi:hypothetical protein KAX03_02410 [Candidatus Bathyarchaeota archaeon]|nr:hypothetical protein [Candidatus Bathyarchaeota archaeon]
MPSLFFHLSGEHRSLPSAEIKAILESRNIPFKNVKELCQVLSLEADESALYEVYSRASYTKACGIELFQCQADETEILEKVREAVYDTLLQKGQTIAVRVARVQRNTPRLDVGKLERKIGGKILEKTNRVKVNLSAPDVFFLGIITDGYFIFGFKMADVPPTSFEDRRLKNRPFFHPSGLHPKLARCMVNLCRATSGSLLLDPFCGTGSILIEAGMIGCKIVGSDVKPSMVEGSLTNLRHYNLDPVGLIVADALKLHFQGVDCVATDPPYGRLASTLGSSVEKIIHGFLLSVIDILPNGGCVSISSPKGVKIQELGERLGLEATEEHFIYVHRSLTRELAVLRKK